MKPRPWSEEHDDGSRPIQHLYLRFKNSDLSLSHPVVATTGLPLSDHQLHGAFDRLMVMILKEGEDSVQTYVIPAEAVVFMKYVAEP